jgi:hypothetical protein
LKSYLSTFRRSIIRHPEKLAAALENGLNIHTLDSWGETLLHQAVIDDQDESLKLLLNFHKDTSMKNSCGFTCIQLAQFLDRKKSLEHLKTCPFPLLEVWNDKEAPALYTHKEFKNYMGFDYTPHLVFKNIRFFRRVVKRVSKYPVDSRVSVERTWLGALYKTDIDAGYVPKVRVQFIDKQIGYGLFAEQEFKKGDFIGEYTGEVKRYLFLNGISNEYVGEYALGGKDPVRFVIDARYKGNHTRFINHGDDPNASAVTVISGGLLHVVLRAERPILKDEEITFDYGPDYWKSRKNKKRPSSSCPKMDKVHVIDFF